MRTIVSRRQVWIWY